jgi:formylglycine-generating enzyme required for sulfatase activity
VIGSTAEEAEETGKAYEQYHLDQGNADIAERARKWPQSEINDRSFIVSTFEIARYPLTNAQYALFIQDGGYDPGKPWWDIPGVAWLQRDEQATESPKRWQKRQYKQHPEFWNNKQFGIERPNYPVVTVTWYEAVAFCRWLTQHEVYNSEGYLYTLPSEAEWEYVARRATRRIYPWGNERPDVEHANFNLMDHTTTVGCFTPGATPEECIYDLSGNVWEWTRSEYKPYPYNLDDGRENMNNPSGKFFTLRGYNWGGPSIFLRASRRVHGEPEGQSNGVGFRLVRYPPDKA